MKQSAENAYDKVCVFELSKEQFYLFWGEHYMNKKLLMSTKPVVCLGIDPFVKEYKLRFSMHHFCTYLYVFFLHFLFFSL